MSLKDFKIQRKALVPESSFKVAETLAQVFHFKIRRIFKKCFVEAMFCRTSTQKFASEIAKFQATSSRFIQESVVFNCLSIKITNPSIFLSTCPYFILKSFYPNTFLITTLFQKKKEGNQDMEFEGVLVKTSRDSRID